MALTSSVSQRRVLTPKARSHEFSKKRASSYTSRRITLAFLTALSTRFVVSGSAMGDADIYLRTYGIPEGLPKLRVKAGKSELNGALS